MITKDSMLGVLYVMGTDNQPIYYPQAEELVGKDRATLLEMYCIKVGKDVFLTLDQWYDRTGITKKTIRHRLQAGWPMVDAVNTPGNAWRLPSSEPAQNTGGRPAQVYELNGEKHTLKEWSEQ